jgi:cell division transport system permease protein
MSRRDDKHTHRRLKSSYITTIISISLVLYMLGLIGVIVLNGQKLSVIIRENIGVSVILKANAAEKSINELTQNLEKKVWAKSVEYITREQAAQELKEALGEDFIGFLGYNPLLPGIEIRLNAPWANVDSMLVIEKGLMANRIVDEVLYQKSLVHLVNENIRRISIVLLAFSLMLLLIAVALINNTIRLSVYAKRFLIRSMQLVGANRSFIRKPFLKQGVWHGILSALIALVLLGVTIWFSQHEMPELKILQDVIMLLVLSGFVILLGVFISLISTFFAVGKYLNSSLDDLYYS